MVYLLKNYCLRPRHLSIHTIKKFDKNICNLKDNLKIFGDK